MNNILLSKINYWSSGAHASSLTTEGVLKSKTATPTATSQITVWVPDEEWKDFNGNSKGF